MTIDELKERMQTGIVKFSYRKIGKGHEGEIRQASGTLCPKYFSYESKGGKKPSDDVFVYWDIEREAFRCFRKDQFIG